ISSKYPDDEQRPPLLEEAPIQSSIDALLSGNKLVLVASIVAVAILTALLVVKVVKRTRWSEAGPVALVVLSLVAFAFLQYHIGAILLMFGAVFWVRNPGLPKAYLLVALVLVLVMSITQLGVLHS